MNFPHLALTFETYANANAYCYIEKRMGKFQSRLQKITQKSQPFFHRHPPPHTHTLTGAPLECAVYGLNNQLHSSLPHLYPGRLQKQLSFMLENLSFLVAVSTSKENSLNGLNVCSARGFDGTQAKPNPRPHTRLTQSHFFVLLSREELWLFPHHSPGFCFLL